MKFAGVLLVFLVAASAARAGIYNSTQAETVRAATHADSGNVFAFLETLRYVRSIGIDKVEKDNRLRKSYLLCEALAGARPTGALTLEQSLDYSAVLIRRKKFQQAVDLLTPLARRHPENFLLGSHLAMAYWGSGQQGYDQRAVSSLSESLKRAWPKTYGELSKEQLAFVKDSMGWNEADFDFFRRAESYLLELMKRRLAEPAGKPYESVDAIFDDGQKPPKAMRFVNEAGTFEPGRTAAAELRKLPRDALAIVEQLTLWLPEDLRLYWLLGEVANTLWTPGDLAIDPNVPKAELNDAIDKRERALANLQAANAIFNELVEAFSVRAADLRERRQILREFMPTIPKAPVRDEFGGDENKKPDKDLTPSVPMNERLIATTFVAGLAVGIFAVWQFQEIRRRRRGG